MSVEQTVRDYILENFLFTTDASVLGVDESFLAKGIIDSTGMLEVIFFLEDKFGIRIDDAEMIPENLDSISNIVRFVARKTKKPTP